MVFASYWTVHLFRRQLNMRAEFIINFISKLLRYDSSTR